MKLKLILLLATISSLYACGTRPFIPQEYPLRDGLVAPLNVSGNVTFKNVQKSKEQAIVYSYGGTQLASNYNQITQVMVDQANKELQKNAKFKSSGKGKKIDISIDYLLSTYKFMYWNSELRYTAKLGNGVKIAKTVTHGSGSLAQDLNGCIAEAVIDLYKDKKVLSYLAE